MASSYHDLKGQISAWRERAGDGGFAGQIDTFIRLCEADVNRQLRVQDMEASAELLPVDGAYNLPSDYLEWRRVTATTTPRRKLDFLSSETLDRSYPHRAAGMPSAFTIEGNRLIVMPVTASAIELDYYRQIPPLSDGEPTNWLLARHPDAYLFGTLLQAAIWEGDQAAAQAYRALYVEKLAYAEQADMGARFAGGSARVRGRTP